MDQIDLPVVDSSVDTGNSNSSFCVEINNVGNPLEIYFVSSD